MCGITGIVNLDFKPVQFDILKKMSDIQKHRGPDDQGFAEFSFQKETIDHINIQKKDSHSGLGHGALGFNRLSILDLSSNGNQPMISEDGKVAIVYNGETYNAFQYKPELINKGYRFKSNTDTEIILKLYQEYGIKKLLDLANGMFGFCIVDVRLKKIFLARDHVGIKPLYWFKYNNTLLFASEIKTFLMHPDFNAKIEKKNIDEYLFYKYNAFDRTLFKGVYQVPAGHFLEITQSGLTLKNYWTPETFSSKLNKDQVLSQLEERIKISVESQLLSDVKVGCQLSGGIDSSLVTTFARKHFEANMDTFSVIPENKSFSEEEYIDQVIRLTQPAAHKFNLGPEYFFQNVVSATWHLDVPLPIPQTVGLKRLAEGATESVTVLLSGEGSDELMGGYVQHYNQAFKMKNENFISLMSKIPGKGNKIKNQYLPHISEEDYFIKYRAALPLNEFERFNPNANLDAVWEQRRNLYPNNQNRLAQIRYYDMKTWLVNILNMQDKMTMAHSIENRVPFLDKNLINFVFSQSSDLFVKSDRNPFKYNSPNKNTKILLKKLANKYYSNNFVYRKKMGFNQPLHDFFAYPKMKELVNDLILPGIKTRGLVDYKKVETAWFISQNSKTSHHLNLFWLCFSLELWAQIFIDRSIYP
jgi:asparagine synthase (glutamine-hydrolysing)